MNSERNVSPSGCASSAWRISIVSSLIRATTGSKAETSAKHDLPAGVHLELARSALGAAAQPLEQLAGGLAAGVSVALEKRGQALLAQAAGVGRAG